MLIADLTDEQDGDGLHRLAKTLCLFNDASLPRILELPSIGLAANRAMHPAAVVFDRVPRIIVFLPIRLRIRGAARDELSESMRRDSRIEARCSTLGRQIDR
jgi:hypothetical protein